MAFMLGNHLTFIDSFQFMSSSLDKLVSNLPKDDLIYTSQVFKGKTLNLMSQKGVYPYDFMDSFEKFDQTELPTKDQFYSILNDQHITDDEYNHAKKVSKTFKIKTMGEYHDLYLESDVLLITDVFENFRKTCLQYYKLDPCHYFTSPGLSWDAMLKMTNIKLELMTDIDMFQFIEKGIRGGVSYIANQYGNANNKYMKEYDEKAPSKYIMYLDENNLYGWAMSQYLPTGNFKWMSDKEINRIDLGKYKADGKKGLISEVDLEYPQELHDLHNAYPLAPEKTKVSSGMLSQYCKKIADKYKISIGLVNKLIPTLRDKKEYVLHYRNLQLYLDLGLKIKKVHRVLKFDQSPWLKQYIIFNTEKRKHAKNTFEKDFFKLMNNSVFGKTMEHFRKTVDVKLVTNEKKLDKLTSKPTYVSSKIFNQNLMAVHKIKETLTLNRPAYVGMCILDLSKTLMYDFYYNYIKKKYNDRAKLLFTDTDSLTYEIETVDAYKDFWTDKDMFDSSDYPENSPYYYNTNKKIIGKFKDEACGIPITEFVGLKSKMYSYVKDNEKGGETAKGIKKNVIKNNIRHEDYKRTLLNEEQMHHKMKTIRSQRHQLGSYEINKVSLSCCDDKRYIHDKNKRSCTEAYQTHEDCGYGYKVVCCYDDKYSKDICIYRGENAVHKFMEKMLEEVKYCKAVIKKHFNKPLVMTEDDEQRFRTMNGCHICGEKYTDKDVRVRDPCHITGKFRGSAHQECNLKLRIKPEDIKIPVTFHNLRGYDSHFIMQQIGEIAKKHAYTNKKGDFGKTMETIRSQRHQLGSYEINKVSLSCFDDKCYIHDNGTSSYAYGHYKI